MKTFYFKGIMPIANLAQKGSFRNVYAIARVLNEETGEFDGVLTIKEDSKKTNNGHVYIKGFVRDGKISFIMLSNRTLGVNNVEVRKGEGVKDQPQYFEDITLFDEPTTRTVGENIARIKQIGEEKVLCVTDQTAIKGVYGATLFRTTKKELSTIVQPILLEDYRSGNPSGKQKQDRIDGDFLNKNFKFCLNKTIEKLVQELDDKNLRILDQYNQWKDKSNTDSNVIGLN